MAIDVHKPNDYRRSWKGGVDLMRRVTVCDACLCASCWHGKFLCDKARTAGTTDVTLGDLIGIRGFLKENEEYWFTDPASGMVDHAALDAYRKNYPEACSPQPQGNQDASR